MGVPISHATSLAISTSRQFSAIHQQVPNSGNKQLEEYLVVYKDIRLVTSHFYHKECKPLPLSLQLGEIAVIGCAVHVPHDTLVSKYIVAVASSVCVAQYFIALEATLDLVALI